MTEIKYPLDRAEIGRMMAIERQSFPSPWSEDDVDAALSSGGRLRCLGITDGGTLVGWGCFGLGPGFAHIMTLAIDPAYRHRGFGKRLLDSMLLAASDAGARYAELECREGNKAAQALYKRAGFKQAGRQERYYTDTGEDALIYVKIPLPEGDSGRDPYLIREQTGEDG